MLGDPWAIIVLRDIMFGNRRHFREILAGSEEGITTNILASRLKQLVTYSLTEACIQVLPVLVALGNWCLTHRDGVR